MHRASLFLFGIIYSLASVAQITFYGTSEPVKTVNSAAGEHYLYLDQNELYLTREKYAGNTGGQADRGDIWISHYDSVWSEPVRLASNDRHFAAPLGITADGKYLLYGKTWFDRGMYYSGIFASNQQTGSVIEVAIPFFRNRSPLLTGQLSADGRYLLLSLENSAGYGVDDLFMSTLRQDGTWTSPKNLGYQINTSFQEITPFLAPDNKTLFFATNGRGGEGSFDLFQSTRLDDTWQNWTEPRNLGISVNTPGAEGSFIFNNGADFAYFVSTQNSDGYGDIKRIRISSDIEKDTVEQQVAEIKVVAEDSLAFVTFQLQDRKTGKPVSGSGIVLRENDTVRLQPTSGGQLILQPESETVTVEFRARGYLSSRQTIDENQFLTNQEIWLVNLEPLATGNVITLQNVLFYKGTANFIEGSESELDLVTNMLKENPEVKIFLKGHTDNVGNPVLNIQLSQQRVEAVTEYLINQGISGERISGKGFGGSEPVADNSDEETRKLNRRVEFEVIRD